MESNGSEQGVMWSELFFLNVSWVAVDQAGLEGESWMPSDQAGS